MVKRTFDLALTIPLLLCLAPVIALLTILVRFKLGSPAFFLQPRPGLHGRPFTMRKFRTMTDAHDAQGNLLPDAERMTSLGRFLRASSLDELPELLNVLKGEMSLVGPRPLLMRYLERYSPEQRRRLEARPGITGWAQINGRNALSWDEKFKFDLWYVDNRSFLLDLRILIATIGAVATRRGINNDKHVTMPPFLGD